MASPKLVELCRLQWFKGNHESQHGLSFSPCWVAPFCTQPYRRLRSTSRWGIWGIHPDGANWTSHLAKWRPGVELVASSLKIAE
jgi:hypothetical protein